MRIEQHEIDALEALIDRVGVMQVAEAIALIAQEKALHVETNRQDSGLAKTWMRVSRRFDKLLAPLELSDDILGFESHNNNR
jgi:hypothetical protein